MDSPFLKAIPEIPLHWTCVDCKREFPNRPDSEHAEGFRTAERELSNGQVQRYIVGNLCKRCMPKPAFRVTDTWLDRERHDANAPSEARVRRPRP